MMDIAVFDTNILIDILEPDPSFGPASREALGRCLQEGSVVACEVVWAEVLTAYNKKRNEAVDVLKGIGVQYSAMTYPRGTFVDDLLVYYLEENHYSGTDKRQL